MSELGIVCCNKKVKIGNLTFLKDLKDFTARKMFAFRCPKCNQYQVWRFEKRISDGQVFVSILKGKEAVKFVLRENNAKRIIQTLSAIESDNLYGWIYGVNVQIRNRKGVVSQLRQYSSDFHGNRTLVKKIMS